MLDLTPIEQEALDTLLAVRDTFFMDSKVGRVSFQNIMGKVRTAIARLENKRYGCWSGRHTGDCTCTAIAQGTSEHSKYYYKRKLVRV